MLASRKISIYLSSTFGDLKEVRALILDELQKTYDVYSMEIDAAGDIPVLRDCMEQVRNCDIYILIIGDRYGSIPTTVTGEPALYNGSALAVSFTEFEFKVATCQQIPEVSVVDPGYNYFPRTEKPLILPFVLEVSDESALPESLRKFRAQMAGLHAKPFKNKDQLAKEVLGSLLNRLSNNPKLLTKLLSITINKTVSATAIALCDRQPQQDKFDVALVADERKSFFLLRGYADDMHQLFTDRIVQRSFNSEAHYVKFRVGTDAFYTPEEIRDHFKTQILMQTTGGRALTVGKVNADSLQLLQRGPKNIVVTCYIDKSATEDREKRATVQAGIRLFYQDFFASKAHADYFFFVLVEKKEPGILDFFTSTDDFLKALDFAINLPDLKKVTDDDLKKWLVENAVFDDDTASKHPVVVKSRKNKGLFMREVTKELNQIISNEDNNKQQSGLGRPK